MKITSLPAFFLIPLLLACFGLSPQARATCQEGCDSSLFNAFLGDDALISNSIGSGNTAIGWRSLFLNSDASFNTAIGGGALALNNADSNTAVGAGALLLNTNGTENTAVGINALLNNFSGGQNTANGAFALFHNFAFSNTAVGTKALFFNVWGEANTAVGTFAMFNNTDASYNTAFGWEALSGHLTGNFNNAFGGDALILDQTGTSNNAFGTNALASNVSGVGNTAVGDIALYNSLGDYNTALGFAAGTEPFIGSNNIYIGDTGFENDNNVIAIGRIASSGIPYEKTYIGGIYDTVVTDRIVYVGSDGHLGTLASSRRYKEEIKPMENVSEAVLRLKPVTFRYNQQIDPQRKLSFGLIAEDVAQISPDLVSCDKEGKPRTVRYEAVNAMLLNEFLKEHSKVQELEANAARQQKQIEGLTAGLQEVKTQVATNRIAPQTIVSNQ